MRQSTFTIISKVPIEKEHEGIQDGVNDAYSVRGNFVARENNPGSPYLIPNEIISGNVAQFLKLPIPPFGLMRQIGAHKGYKTMFASMRFTRRDSEPDDFAPEACFECMPDLCTGIILFDILIANEDRHSQNIQTNSATRPTIIRIIDHDRSLLGVFKRNGLQRLKKLEGRLGISGGAVTGGNRHCLIDHVTTTEHFSKWLTRIEAIPDWFIEETCLNITKFGATLHELAEVAQFLKNRKRSIHKIINDNISEFTRISERSLIL